MAKRGTSRIAAIAGGLALTLAARGVGGAGQQDASPGGAMTPAAQKAFVQQYCVGCHNDAQLTGGLTLESFDPAHADAGLVGTMVDKLRAGEMPPKNKPRPDAGTLYAFITALSGGTPAASHAAAVAPASLAAPEVIPFAHKGDVMTVADQNAMVRTICTQCHTDRQKPGGLSLEHFDMTSAPEHREIAETMIAKLRAGLMPPLAARKRPDQASIEAFVASLERRIDRVAALHPDPGYRLSQRLNRAEYASAIRSMFGLSVDVSQWLPPDTISHNFDNIAAVQNFSPTLLQSYMQAADEISRLAVGDRQAEPLSASYDVGVFKSQMDHIPGTPMGSRGGLSVVHIFPADGSYRFKLLFYGTPIGDLYGLTTLGEQIEVSIDGRRVALLDIDPKMSELDPKGLMIETPPIHIQAGPQRVSAAFVGRTDAPIDDLIAPQAYTLSDQFIGAAQGITALPHLRTLTVSGPFRVTGVSNTVSRERIFICRPTSPDTEAPCARKIVGHLADQAYRRPATAAEIADLMKFYDQGRADGGFESGIRMALQAMLVSTRFLFRFEPQPLLARAGQPYRIDDAALASRLSYFLWASAPDEELVKLAKLGQLRAPGVLEAQVRRMLKDPRSFSLSTRFASQWLRLQDVDKVHPDALMYPMYDARIAAAMKEETERFFDSFVKGDRDVLELLTANDTYVNENLAAFYGIPNVAGTAFRKVSLDGTHRRGLLGQGSILVETSVADRTDPVLRGKWVLEVLLGQPPPPPPPNVPALAEAVSGGRSLSVRQRMEEHRKNPFCASCHRVIDPIGLALENFDPTGHWRLRDNEVPVDVATELYDGTRIAGLDGLDEALLKHKDTFLRVFTENLMAYALGRQVQYFDMPTVRAILHRASASDNRFTSFVLGIVGSDAFQMSRADSLNAGRRAAQPVKSGVEER